MIPLNSLFKPIFQDFDFSHFLIPDSICEQNINQLTEKIIHSHLKPSLTLIYGDKGSGKTHLLKALINEANENNISSLYLSFNLNNIPNLSSLTDGLDLLCLDDGEKFSGKNQSLMIYEAINKNKIHLVVSINQHPSELEMINDLKTRLQSGSLIKINRLSDRQIFDAFKLKCHAKGIVLNEKVAANFLKQTKRNMHQITDNLENLVIFAKGKKITSKIVNQYFESQVQKGI